ncbi:dihydroorotate dehydrogenase [Oceaniglobus trochenteri]|uniref:dihydroorotate dehydrogenase n=1 Tax=Oceaniglobus trochenteri TaxID=2763260 RepID=UPI001CFF8E40|nr:dihydroorotate dehydrogenase [Oceaniglobus trochenteri]
MTERKNDDTALEALFAEARRESAPLPDDLFARIMADAESRLPAAPAASPRRQSRLAALGAMLGGWPSMAGLATATLAGVWIGVAQPSGLSDLGLWSGDGVQAGYELGDMMPGYDSLTGEG